MIVYRSLEEVESQCLKKPVILTTGMFDGLHLAHRELVGETVDRAHEAQGSAVVFTFGNHPLSVLAPSYAPQALMSCERKAWMLEQLGVDVLVQMDFSESFASILADDFVRDILMDRFHIEQIIVGYDFRYGFQGLGTAEILSEVGQELGFGVEVVRAMYNEEWPISSTRIRELINAGRVGNASKLLGRPYDLAGPVGKGHGRGKALGFPTANLEINSDFVTPASGVYAVLVQLGDAVHYGMLNIGSSPTFSGTEYRLEVFLINYEGADFYEQTIRIFFVERIREERKFPSSQALVERLKKDQQIAGSMLDVFALRDDLYNLKGVKQV